MCACLCVSAWGFIVKLGDAEIGRDQQTGQLRKTNPGAGTKRPSEWDVVDVLDHNPSFLSDQSEKKGKRDGDIHCHMFRTQLERDEELTRIIFS